MDWFVRRCLDFDLSLAAIFTERCKGVSKYWQILDDCLLDSAPLCVPVSVCHLNAKSGDVSPRDRGMDGLERVAQARCRLSNNLHLAHYRRAVDVVMLMLCGSAVDPLDSIEDMCNTVVVRGCHNGRASAKTRPFDLSCTSQDCTRSTLHPRMSSKS